MTKELPASATDVRARWWQRRIPWPLTAAVLLTVLGAGAAVLVLSDADGERQQQPAAGTLPGVQSHRQQEVQRADQLILQSEPLFQAGQYDDAIRVQKQALAIYREQLGTDDLRHAGALYNLALAQYRAGRYEEAEPLFKQALSAQERAGGSGRSDALRTRTALAGFYLETGRYEQAEPLMLEALEQARAAGDSGYPGLFNALRNLARLSVLKGDHERAEPLIREAHEICSRVVGENHPDYAYSLSSLADMHRVRGEYPVAELLYQRSLRILRETAGDENIGFAVGLNNLAGLYDVTGDFARAETYYRQTSVIWRKLLGDSHPDYAMSLHNLANVCCSLEDFEQAEQLYRKSAGIWKSAFGEEHFHYALSLNNLAWLYHQTGEDDRAEPLMRKAIAIHARTLGPQSADYAGALRNLAALHGAMGKFTEAERLCRQALGIVSQSRGIEHSDYADTLQNLAQIYLERGEYPRAAALLSEVLGLRLRTAERMVSGLSAVRARNYLDSNYVNHHRLLSVLRRLPHPDPVQAQAAVWRTRGLITQQQLEQRALSKDSAEAETLWRELRAVQQQLAQLTLATVAPDQAATRQERLTKLNDRKEELEVKLGRLSAEFRRSRQVQRAEPADLVGALKQGAAVVELVQSLVWPAEGEGEPQSDTEWRYDAFVLRPDESERGYSVAWIELGPVEQINDAATGWLKETLRPAGRGQVTPLTSTAVEGPENPGHQLRDLVWSKLEPRLEGVRTVVIIPDGSLTRIPWAALPGKQPGTFLLEDYAIATCSNGRQLYAALTAPEPQADSLLLLGDVAYKADRTAVGSPLLTASGGAFRSPALTDERSGWGSLPGTKRELEQIQELLPQDVSPTALSGDEATELRLRQALPGARWIHLATHGFFADETFRSWLQHDTQGEQLFGGMHTGRQQATVTGRNPLILSGVVLAGANQPAATDDLGLPTGQDGILTAEEIVSLDLRNAELVVLSACETGLGEVAGGEGVMGLQRAFHLAGARTTVASLWKVDDAATQALMVEFYRNLWQKKLGRLESLRQAQLTMLRSYDPQKKRLRGAVTRIPQKSPASPRAASGDLPPYYWAAFTLSGDWR